MDPLAPAAAGSGGLSGARTQAALECLSPRRRVFENAQLISRSASPAASSFRQGGCEGGPPSYPSIPAQLQKSFPVLCPGACLWQSGFGGTSIPLICSGGRDGGRGCCRSQGCTRRTSAVGKMGKTLREAGEGSLSGDVVLTQRGFPSAGERGVLEVPGRWLCPTDSDSGSRRGDRMCSQPLAALPGARDRSLPLPLRPAPTRGSIFTTEIGICSKI